MDRQESDYSSDKREHWHGCVQDQNQNDRDENNRGENTLEQFQSDQLRRARAVE